MSKGWISIHRKLQCHWLWGDKPFSKGQAWIDLLLLANHEDTKFLHGGQLIDAKRGDVITSEVKLMDRWGWSKSKVRTFLEMLEKDSMIIKKADSKKTTLTIVNYGVWQDSQTAKELQKDQEKTDEKPLEDRSKTADELQKDTINNVNNSNNSNNSNNDNKDISSIHRFKPPTLEEVQSYCLERNNDVDPEKWHSFYESKGWMIGKNKMKNWRAAVITWEKGDKPKSNKEVNQPAINQGNRAEDDPWLQQLWANQRNQGE